MQPLGLRCDGNTIFQCLKVGGAWLDRHVALVNALNVFPVPDGDTGTNMSLTVRAALEEVDDQDCASVSGTSHALAQGALMGARGNSGVILSQILRGLARALDGRETFDGADLAEALQQGAVTAYKGVMKPVEGTILTVIRESAEAAKRAASQGADAQEVLATAVTEARASVERTPSLLSVLAEAGVVDAGGQGLMLIMEGMLRHMRGEAIEMGAAVEVAHMRIVAPEGEYNYDTQFVIRGEDLDVARIREEIANMGDSVLVVGTGDTVKVHVHCDHPGVVLDYGISQGKVTSVMIENMQLQYEEFKAGRQPPVDPVPAISPAAMKVVPGEEPEIGIIAVVSGEGLARVLDSLGVSAIVPGGQTMNPSTQDLLQAIDSVPSDQIILLPNNKNIIMAAEQAKELSPRQVMVVPTRTVPQGIAALLAFNYQAGLGANVELMLEASRQVETAEITRAVRSVQVDGLSVAEGQIIGLLNGDLVAVGEEAGSVAEELLRRVGAEEYEIVTIYHGEGVSLEEAEALAEGTRRRFRGVEVETVDGGQAHYFYIISIE